MVTQAENIAGTHHFAPVLAILRVFLATMLHSALHDGILKDLLESVAVPQQAGTDKVDHSVELRQIILDRRAGEDNASWSRKRLEHLGRLCIFRLETVTLVADDQVDWRLRVFQLVHAGAQLFVADDHHRVGLRVEKAFDRGALVAVDAQDIDGRSSEPLAEFAFPVLQSITYQ